MPKFIVKVREVHVQDVLVDAETREAAIEAVADGEGEYVDGAIEYSHSLDTDTWSAEECREPSSGPTEPYDYRLCENTP